MNAGHRQLGSDQVGTDDHQSLRRSASAQAAPRGLALVLTTAAGLASWTAAPRGRDAQSGAFFSWPGMEPLYSGVAISTAPAPAISSRSSATGSGPHIWPPWVRERTLVAGVPTG